ncbi:probable indole-3-acetic acid-amido synthetase GH3.1 [Selaginella moellendorffii]|uniref:probable indole-3-acetic acid-amido synthetase GH3.1 n=1 Tax=Selaginella moellendorffii TaxID=88036 RepID=UPI000D1CE8F3|nr:probable indole-3-acetic acid-amido synthetase GH3.1 [Selaginella moellendorffii]|eukprot:XP_024539134.1 probable indole-3-acetic acid-amido synthetase GH3.1 [Selaginella moellendorffii]
MDPALSRDDIESKTKDAAAVQANLLSQMMELNGETEYLRRYGGRFDSLLIIEYHDVADDIQRIANGDTSPILTAEPVVRFFTRYAATTFL